jgi:hypothetical protein
MNNKTAKRNLEILLEWARTKAHNGSEPPWAWYQYMKLIETIEAIIKGMDSVSPTASLQQSDKRQGSGLQLVDSKFQQGTFQRHQGIVEPQLPT